MQKHVNLVDLVKSFPTNIYLQNLASIQKRTSPIKFAHLAEKSGKGSISNLSTKVGAALDEASTRLKDVADRAAAADSLREMTGLVADMRNVLAECSAAQVAEVEAAAAEAALQLETFNRQADEAIQSLRETRLPGFRPRFDAVKIRSTKKDVGNAAIEAAASVAKARAAFDAAETAVRAANSALKPAPASPDSPAPIPLR